MSKRLTAIIQRENDGFVALCPELDVASQGDSIESARDNLREALELFFECASPSEIQRRMGGDQNCGKKLYESSKTGLPITSILKTHIRESERPHCDM